MVILLFSPHARSLISIFITLVDVPQLYYILIGRWLSGPVTTAMAGLLIPIFYSLFRISIAPRTFYSMDILLSQRALCSMMQTESSVCAQRQG